MPQVNGEGDRLDRIEKSLETLVSVCAGFAVTIGDLQEGHKRLIAVNEQIQEEQKFLLTAQVVLTDRLDKLTQRVDHLTQAQAEQAESAKDANERLNALIRIVDEIIRKRPPLQ